MKYLFTPYIYILFFLWNFSQLNAQNFKLNISTNDSIESYLINQINIKENYKNVKNIVAKVDSLKLKFEQIGYLNSRLDSLTNKDSIYTAYFFLGKSTKKIRIYYDNTIITKKDLFRLTKNVSENYFETTLEKVSPILNQLVFIFEDIGKSFTTINLKDISFDKEYINAKLNIKLSNNRTIDKIVIKGYENFPKTFLKHYLNLKINSVFNTKKINTLSKNIKSLAYVSEVKPPEILFTKDSTYLYLYLKKQKANKFDGLIGFTSNENNNGLNFNGYLDLELINILNGGENIVLNWKNNGDDKQVFNLGMEIPYIFNTAITPKFNLNIYKQDSTFINTNVNLELGYLINYRNKISLILNSISSDNLLDNQIDNINSFSSNQYGVSYNYKVLNNSILFPTKFNLNITGTLGNRNSNDVKTSQSQINFQSSYLWSFNFRNHFFIQNTTSLLNSNNYLINELFRIGGVNSIRGFNEESIFASLYSILNLEYRYNSNIDSYFYTISDFAFIENQLENKSQQIFSLGLGYAFNTSFGLLNLSYAIGKFDDDPFNFDNSRFHLKIISIF